MSKVVVSKLRVGPVAFLMATGAVIGACVLYSDITGRGLTDTQLYRVLGYAIYPVFYGALAVGLWQFASMLSKRADYLTVDGDQVSIGRKTILGDDISSISLRHTSLVSELVFQRRNGSDIIIKSYMLSRPANEVLAHLHSLLFKPQPMTA